MPTELPNERRLHAPGEMELDPTGDGLAIDESPRLIASSKVEGASVFDRRGEMLGTIHTVMIDKLSGQVAYAVLATGGFLGVGESYRPLPWRAMAYDVRLGGYVVDLDGTVPAEPATADADDEYGAAAAGLGPTAPT